jgi:FkbM family methyltransferase
VGRPPLSSRLQAIADTTRLARLVRETGRFWLRVAARRTSLSRYHVRRSGVSIHIRHGTVDVITLDQIFGHGHYAPAAEVAAVLESLPNPLRIVDVGANIGLFGADVRGRYPRSRITAFEPHPENVRVHELTIAANAAGSDWSLVAAFADVRDGSVPFAADEFTTGRIDELDGSAAVVPAVDVFPYLADVDYLKVDIEGAEWALLDDPRFTAVPARVVALEYHTHRCPGPDPRAAARQRLERAGFATRDAEFDASEGHGMLWGWKNA